MPIGVMEISKSGGSGHVTMTPSLSRSLNDEQIDVHRRTLATKARKRCTASVVIGIVCATTVSLLLSIVATVPRIGPVPLPAACERCNTPATWLATFMIGTGLSLMAVTLADCTIEALRRRRSALGRGGVDNSRSGPSG